MKILLTNDDGYTSGGLKVLKERLEKENEVYVLAPDSNRSAVSHHFTMYSEGKIEKVSDRVWKCSGYPADCAFIGMESNFISANSSDISQTGSLSGGFDVVISGINFGPNLGTDIIYSGTCAAAREAVLRGIPGIAVSLDPIDWYKAQQEGFKFDALADFIAKNLNTLISMCKLSAPRSFVNVNAASLDKYEGAVITENPCVRTYHDTVTLVKETDSIYKTVLNSGDNTAGIKENTDLGITRKGYIAVSSIYADPVCCKVVDGLKFSM